MTPEFKPKHTAGRLYVDESGLRVLAEVAGFVPTPEHPHFVVAQCHTYCSPKPEEARANAQLFAEAGLMHFLLHQIMADLPQRRDWLDPVIEREARAVLGRLAERETSESTEVAQTERNSGLSAR